MDKSRKLQLARALVSLQRMAFTSMAISDNSSAIQDA
jgi:hypothetical protein